jgi:hypothetical protein
VSLEYQSIAGEKSDMIDCQNWIEGRQASRLLSLRAEHRQEAEDKGEKFLAEMEVFVPWDAMIDLIETHYPRTSKKGGRPLSLLATMPRIILLQQGFPPQ